MKKKKYMLLVGMIMMLAVVMTGCSDVAEDRLEDEVDRLEQQVTDLQKEQAAGNSGTTNTTNTTNTDNAANGGMTTGTSQDFATLEAEVNALVEKVDAALPDSAEAGKLEQYFALKKEIEAVDRKMDAYDDMIEQQYRQNAITLEDLKTQERNVDMLENKLDSAEDKLEITFGIDD